MAYPETVASHAARTELCSGRGVRERGDGNFFEMGQGIRKDCLRWSDHECWSEGERVRTTRDWSTRRHLHFRHESRLHN